MKELTSKSRRKTRLKLCVKVRVVDQTSLRLILCARVATLARASEASWFSYAINGAFSELK